MLSKKTMWTGWIVMTASLTSYYAYGLAGKDKSAYLPGQTTGGHYQIELACGACHSDPFGGKEVLQKACVKCHGAELKLADDSHPKSKFTDPRNADRVAVLDARYCVTCHVEHVDDRTHVMGVTLPVDFCAYCHRDIAKDRPSHKDMAFDTCAAAGCHNFHDNKALYEDFLVKHGEGEKLTVSPVTVARTFAAQYRQQHKISKPLTLQDAVYPATHNIDRKIVLQWEQTAHARSAVNCGDCHAAKSAANTAGVWQDKPTMASCQTCHERESETYQLGKHGMRLAQDLPPMRTSMARQAMKSGVQDDRQDCMSCHGSHEFDTRQAAVKACLSCHDDKHSRAYKASPHYQVWRRSLTGQAEGNAGVSCATCHLPRLTMKHQGENRTLVQHNQNDNLRPNEKMIREVCLACHGLGFSIDALADPKLIANNFNGMPQQKIPGIAMAIKREKEKPAKKRKQSVTETTEGSEEDE
jgi:hypothetical protein